MADKTPLRAVFNDSSIATGLAEFQSGDTIPVTHGGTGLSSLGSALQVLRVNSAGNALEFAAAAGTQNVFSTISVAGQSNVVADATTDTLTIAAGTGITVTTTAGTDTVTFATSAITSVAADTSPQLGGDLDVNGNSIISASNGNISITPNGSGKIILDGLSFPTSDGSANQVLKTDGSGQLSFVNQSGGGTAPTVSSISPSIALPSTSTAITITGTGFVSVPIVNAINSSTGAIITPSAVTFTNATTIVATFNESTQASYYIRVENNDGLAVRSSSALLSISQAPSWSTSAGSLGTILAGATLSGISVSGSSDSTVAYSETTSVLTSNSNTPSSTMNLTLNSSTGAITGTAPNVSASTTYNFTIRLTDGESQTADRAFSLTVTGGIEQSGQFIP